jgi:hypothetical protein
MLRYFGHKFFTATIKDLKTFKTVKHCSWQTSERANLHGLFGIIRNESPSREKEKQGEQQEIVYQRNAFNATVNIHHLWRDSNEARSGPSHEDDERDNVFIDQNARQSQTPKLFIDPKERITIPSYNVKPNFETLERLNGAYEALRRPNKRFKTESSIFNSLRTKGSTHYESVQAPVFKQASSSQHRSTEAQSNAWYQKKSKSRENLSLSQRSRMLDHRHDVIIPDQMTTPVYSSFSLPPLPSSSTTEEIFEWHNQPTTQNGRSSQNRHASVGLSEPSSSTAVQSLHQYWDTEQDPSKNIWISQANSVASAPPTIGGVSDHE